MYPYARSPLSRSAKWTAHATGHPWAFVLAAFTIVVWLNSGPQFGFSDTWQLVINTGTTIVTCLMVFLIQNTQNRESAAIHLKLDELIRTVNGAHNALLDLEELTETDLERLRSRYEALGRAAREDLLRGTLDTDTPDVPVEGGSEPNAEGMGRAESRKSRGFAGVDLPSASVTRSTREHVYKCVSRTSASVRA